MAISNASDISQVAIDDANGALKSGYEALVSSLPLPLQQIFHDQDRAADQWKRRLEGVRDGGSFTIPFAFDSANAASRGFRELALSQAEQTFNTSRTIQIVIGTRKVVFEGVITALFFGIPANDYLTCPCTIEVDGAMTVSTV